MISDPTELLHALNPEPAGRAPAIDVLWRRLEADGSSGEDQGDAVAPWRRGPTWASQMLTVGLAAVAVAIGVGAVLVLHHGRRTAAGPRVAQGTIPSASRGLVGILGVLRRPQTAADRESGSRLLRGALSLRAAVPVMSLVRAAGGTVGGQKVVLVPVRPPVGELWPTSGPANGGSTGTRLALLSGGGGCCSTPAEIEAGQAWSSFGSAAGNYIVLVVPDGVARVTIGLARPVTSAVHDNVAAFSVPRPVENLGVYPMTWLGPSGKVLKRFAPSPQSVLPVTSNPVRVRVARSDEYCTTPRGEKIELCPRSTHGLVRLGGPSSQWLVMFSFNAPRSTPAGGRTYYYFTVDAPVGCPNASQFGEENQAVAAGQRVVLWAAVDQRCPGGGHGTISLITAPSANHFPGQGVARPIGSFAFVIPRAAARTSH